MNQEIRSNPYTHRQLLLAANENVMLCRMAQGTGLLLRMGAIVALVFGGMEMSHHFIGYKSLIFVGGLVGYYGGPKLSNKWENRRKEWQRRKESVLHAMGESLLHTPPSSVEKMFQRLSNYFSGIHFKFMRCINSGKLEDIARYDAPVQCPEVSRVAKKQGIAAISHITLTPFENGVCLGASLYYASEYFHNGGNLDEVDSLFKGGAPYEAVLLQGQCENICSGVVIEDLDQNVSARYQHAFVEMAGLHCGQVECELTKEQAKSSLLEKAEGIYLLRHSNHATLLIREDKKTYIFDPNTGTCEIADLPTFFSESLPCKGEIYITTLLPSDRGDVNAL